MTKKYRAGDLCVWHIPQVPGRAFHYDVTTVDEAKRIVDALAEYDLFQYENLIKGDYCNASGLQVYIDDGEWDEWRDEEDRDLNEIL